MFASIDWNGLGVFVAAVCAGIATLIGAWNNRIARDVQRSVSTNGDPREIGQIASDMAEQIAPHDRPTAVTPPAPETPTP